MEGYADAHSKLRAGEPAMSQQLVELAQLLHAMQQQQMSNQSVVNVTLAQMALQLKQQEQAQAQQAQHQSSLQDRHDEVLDAVACVQQQQEQQQEQQQLDSKVAAQQQQLASEELADVHGQQQSLLAQLEQLRREQRDAVQQLQREQQQWQQEQLEAFQRLQDEQALWREQQQLVVAQLQQQATSMQQEQQSWRQQQEQTLQAIQEQLHELQHATSSASEMQEVQRQLDQQQQQQQGQDATNAIGSLQEKIQQLTVQLQAVQCQQQELCSKASSGASDGSAAADTAADSECQAAVSQGVLDQAVAELERRLLHALQVEGEAGQQLMELRVTAMYERMKGDVLVTQQSVAAQLQQLSSEVQAALASQQQQLQLGAAVSSHVHNSIAAAQPGIQQQARRQQPSDLQQAMQDQSNGQPSRCSISQFRRGPFEYPENSAASKQVPHATASQAGTPLVLDSPGQRYGQRTTAQPHSKIRAWLFAATASRDRREHPQTASAASAGDGVIRQHQPSIAQSKAASSTDVAFVDGSVSRKILNDQEVDVVLQLLGALHGAQSPVGAPGACCCTRLVP